MRKPLPPTRTCLACYEPKPAAAFTSPLGRKCAKCHAAEALRTRVCGRCGEERLRTEYVRGGRTCADCRSKPYPSMVERLRRACDWCYVIKDAEEFGWANGRRRNKGYYRKRKGMCLECEAADKERKAKAAEERRATWEQDGKMVRRCSHCEEVQDLETGFFFAQSRREGLKRWRYWCKACDRERIHEYKARVKDRPGEREKRAAWQRKARAERPELFRAYRQRHEERVKADPERYARRLEGQRMAYRLRREQRDGIPLGEVRGLRVTSYALRDVIECLPAYPLAEVLEAMIARDAGCEDDPRGRICQAAGISPRNLLAWHTGERADVQFNVADRVLVGLGLTWWDVWTGDSAALAQRLFEGEQVAA